MYEGVMSIPDANEFRGYVKVDELDKPVVI